MITTGVLISREVTAMIGNPTLEVDRKILASKLEIFLFLPCVFVFVALFC